MSGKCRRFVWSKDTSDDVGLIPIDDVFTGFVSVYGDEFYCITPEQIDDLLKRSSK